MAMAARHPRKPRPPLTAAKLDELALHYVGRFATSRSKLTTYLKRKLRERGWEGQAEPDLDGLAAKLARLTSRGYGERRVGQALALAGIDEDDGSEARSLAQSEAVESALRFARRRSIGPFAKSPPDPKERERALSAMVRAGHRFGLAKAIVDMEPGADADMESLADSC